MSGSTLHKELTAKLAAATLDATATDAGPSSLSAAQHRQPPLASSESEPDAETDEDDDLVGISTPGSGSRSASPLPPQPSTFAASNDSTATAATSIASKSRSHLSSTTTAAALKAERNKTDPLRAFPSEISQRIFLSLPIRTLLSCSLVCKRWRRSATLNYCWYKQYHALYITPAALSSTTTFSDPSGLVGASTPRQTADGGIELGAWVVGGAKWTRRESRTDWKNAYGKSRRQQERDAQRNAALGGLFLGGGSAGGSGTSTPSRSQRMAAEGVQSARERRLQQWQEEDRAFAEPTKAEMRQHYKSAGGSKGGKLKGKSGKGGVKTGGEADGGLWD